MVTTDAVPRDDRWKRAHALRKPLLLFFVCIAVYNVNLRFTGGFDSLASSVIPFRLLEGKGLTLEEPKGLPETVSYSIVRSRDGSWVSFYPLVTPLLVAPLYVPVVVWGSYRPFANPGVARLGMEKLSGSLIAATSVVVLFLLLRQQTTEGLALLLASAFAFGTCTWATSSQALLQHGAGGLFLTLTLFLLLDEDAGPGKTAFTGLAAGLMAANRPTDVLFWLAAAIVLVRRRGLRSVPFFLVSAVVGGAALAWNLHHFGALTGGYGTFHAADGRLVGQNQFGLPGMLGILFSNRGLFVFSPFLLLALAWRPGKDGPRYPWLGLFLLAYAASLYIHGQSFDWAGGHCYGARYALHGLPVLFVALAGPLERIWPRPVPLALFASAVLFAGVVQVIGAFCYPGNDSGDWRKHGLWSISSSSPVLAARAGLQDPDFLYPFVRRLATARRLAGEEARGRIEIVAPPADAPATLAPGKNIRLAVSVSNLSGTPWSSLGGYFSEGAVKVRVSVLREETLVPAMEAYGRIPVRLRPGETAVVLVGLPAPREPGRFLLRAELTQFRIGPFPPGECPPAEWAVRIESP